MICNLSSLKDNDLNDIVALEKDLGKTLLAFSCHDAKIAKVNEDQLNKIKALEAKMGISLVALDT